MKKCERPRPAGLLGNKHSEGLFFCPSGGRHRRLAFLDARYVERVRPLCYTVGKEVSRWNCVC